MLKRLLLLAAFHAVFAPTASADSVSPNPWYQQVATASFVGVVQCEVAGVVAAKYRVLESWKGPPVGTLLTIDQQFRTYGAYSPFAVCGEKYLACVYSSTYLSLRPFDTTRLASVASPYWWKDAEAEYYTHTLPHLMRLPAERSDDLSVFGIWGKKASFQAYRESVLTYLSTPAAAQEDKALRPFVKSILRVYPQYEPDRGTRVAMEELAVRVDSLGLDSLVNALVTLELDHPEGRMGYPETMLIAFGKERTLAALRSPRGLEAFPGDTLDSRHPLRRVADREIPKRADWNVRVPAYSERDRDAHRSVFASPWGSRFLEAFAWLTEHDPETVMRWFEQDSVTPPREWSGTTPYSLASFFAWRCNSDREAILRRMLNARNPTARVAGAVYLTFEDSTSGTRALRELSELDGFAGTWAATVLASQGDRQAVSRALEVFDLPPPGQPYDDRETRITRGLQARLLVLLSNSAHASGVRMPDVDWARRYYDTHKKFRKGVKELTEWWRKKGDQIQVADPWRPLYSSQRVD